MPFSGSEYGVPHKRGTWPRYHPEGGGLANVGSQEECPDNVSSDSVTTSPLLALWREDE